MQTAKEALEVESRKIRNIHCDKLGCDQRATKRVRPAAMRAQGMRGCVFCTEHAQALYALGKTNGYEWEVTDYRLPRQEAE